MISSPDSPLFCPSCQGVNALDSKFCRHCGHAMDGESVAVSAPAASGLELPDEVLPAVVAPKNGAEAAEALSSPGEIDARHARQLLERAQGLSGRGDTAGAMLACRQAIALAPSVEGGHAMLGALLERSGDMTHALQAFEKAAQLAPDGGARRDVERLREKMGAKPDAPTFHFNDAELFEDEASQPTGAELKTETAAKSGATAAVVAAAGVAETVASGEEIGVDASIPVEATPSEAEAASAADSASGVSMPDTAASDVPIAAIAAAIPPSRERRVASSPVRVERRVNANSGLFPSSSPMPSTPIGARVIAPTVASANVAAPVVNPMAFGDTDSAPQGWSALWARPSYFGRSLPLVGATILSLGFLGWARGLADARNMASAPATVVARAATPEFATNDAVPPASTANPQSSNLPPLAPVGSAVAPSDGFPIRNGAPALAPPAEAGNVTGAQTTRPAARPATSPGSATATRNAQRSAARSPQLLAPAPIPAPGTRPANPRGDSSGNSRDLILPAPNIAQPAPAAPATSVLPAGGTPALNPAGQSGRGYVRITGGRIGSQLPQRPAARANDAEREAAVATRSGATRQAIDGLTAAINANSSDAGFQFQQRAQLFLGQGDYSRAADDFQSAISAYNDQIARGDQVASARAGLRAARSGLNLALAGGR